MIKNKIFICLVLLGVAIRLILATLPGFTVDVNDWAAWAIRLNEISTNNFYSQEVFTDYTPGYLYVLKLLGFLKNLFRLDNNTFYIFLKLPAIICDVSITIFFYQYLKKLVSCKISLLSVNLILFNPALIFNSSVWGQIDSVLCLLMLLALLLLTKKRLITSSIFFGLALLVKPQALAILPIFILFLLKNFSATNFLKLIFPALLIINTLSLPFFPDQTITNFFHHTFNSTETYPYTSLFAYNLWGVIGFWQPDSYLWGNLTYKLWGYILLAFYWSLLTLFYFKKGLPIYLLAALATLAFFFLPTRVHERYLYPAILFLILAAVLLQSKITWFLTILLSFFHFFNLYYVYVYYNEFYFNMPKLFYQPILYSFLNSHGQLISFLSTLIFVLISIIIFKPLYVNKIKS